MAERFEKEVYFNRYCRLCVNKDTVETEDPCNECLDHPVNIYCHKPVKFVEKEHERINRTRN